MITLKMTKFETLETKVVNAEFSQIQPENFGYFIKLENYYPCNFFFGRDSDRLFHGKRGGQAVPSRNRLFQQCCTRQRCDVSRLRFHLLSYIAVNFFDSSFLSRTFGFRVSYNQCRSSCVRLSYQLCVISFVQ